MKIFNHHFDRHTVLQLLLDFCLVTVAFMATLVVLSKPEDLTLDQLGRGLVRAVLMAAGFLAINAILGFYDRRSPFSSTQLRARALVSFSMTGLLVATVLLLLPIEAFYGRTWAVVIVMLATAVLLLYQVLVAELLPKALHKRKVLVFGTGTRAKAVGETLKRVPSTDLCGYFASPNEREAVVTDWGVLSNGRSLSEVVTDKGVDEIVVALTERRGGSMPMRELLDLKLSGVQVTDIANYFERSLGQIRLDAMSAGWLIFGEGFNQGFLRTTVKRLFDIVGASVLLLISFPVMLLTAIAVRLDSPGPIFYAQERVGQNNRGFNVVKFRSMRTDAEKDGVPRWATAGDSRVTRVGRVIRKLRVDELPQLFSVLKGDMSLVGPRPERAFFVEQLTEQIPFYAVRHSVKPGVTGWAQVRYQYGSTIEDTTEKLQYDLYYVKNHSLFLDMVILFETVGVVLTGKGAQ